MLAGSATAVSSAKQEQRGSMQGSLDLSASNGHMGQYMQKLPYVSQAAGEFDGGPNSSSSTGHMLGAMIDESNSTGMRGINSRLHAKTPPFVSTASAAGQSLAPAGALPPALVGPAEQGPCDPLTVDPIKVQPRPLLSSEEQVNNRQAYMEPLLARAKDSGMALLGLEEKLACSARLTATDLATSPKKLLEEVSFMHQQQVQQAAPCSQQLQQQWQAQQQHLHQEDVYYPPPPASQQQQNLDWQMQLQQQQQEKYLHYEQHRQQCHQQQGYGHVQLQDALLQQLQESQQLQQQLQEPQPQQQAAPVPAKVLGPRDLDPAAADVFEASLPAGLLPDNWRDLPRWGAFEMHCKFNVGGSDQETVRQVRNVFRTAKEQAVTATQAAHQHYAAASSTPEQQQPPDKSIVSGRHGVATSQPTATSAMAAGTAANMQTTAALLVDASTPAVGCCKDREVSSERSGSGRSSSGSSSSSSSSHGGKSCCSKRQSRLSAGSPCDLPDDLAAQFAAAIPPGGLPRDWRSRVSWKGVTDGIRLKAFPKQTSWAQARQWVCDAMMAVQQALEDSQDHSRPGPAALQPHNKEPQQQQQPQQQRRQQQQWQAGSGSGSSIPRPCELPPEIASELVAALPDRFWLPEDWQQCPSWRALENMLSLKSRRERKQYRDARHAALDSYDIWKLQQHRIGEDRQQQAHQTADSSCEGVRCGQQQQKRTLAPWELPSAAAAILESLVPAGMLPQQWQKYPTWKELDDNVCYTAGGADKPAVQDTTNRYKEARRKAQAAAAAAAADDQPHSAMGTASLHSPAPAVDLDQDGILVTAQQQQDEKQIGSKSGSSGSASWLSTEPPAAAAAAPPSVSWAQAAAGRPVPSTAPPPSGMMAEIHLSNGQDAADMAANASQQACSRGTAANGSSSKTLLTSTTSVSSENSSSRLGSNGPAAANPPCDEPTRPPAAQPPLNSRYIAVGEVMCSRCGDRGHVVERCKTPYCPSCTQWGHADGIDCLSACHWCGRTHKGANFRCSEQPCKECGLIGHKRHECPLTLCSFCNYNGHTAQDCNACSVCRLWGHDATSCPGFCTKCNAAGHKTADCSVRRCAQCGKVGCVVGMCQGSSGSANSGRGSSRSKSKAAARSTSSSSSSSKAAAAAEVFDISSIVFEVPEDAQQEEAHQLRLMDRLMSAANLEEYACSLLTAPEKLAVLATVSAADLSLILQQQQPNQLLDQIYSMQAIGTSQPAAAAAASSSATQLGEAVLHHDQRSQQQQQQKGVFMPCDLWPQHRHMFEGRLPADSLPQGWHNFKTWRELEQEFINNWQGTRTRISEQRVSFRRERQRVQAAAAADVAAGSKPQYGTEQQEEQQTSQRNPHKPQGNDQQQDQSCQQQHSSKGLDRPLPGQNQQLQQRYVDKGGWPDLNHQEQQQQHAKSDTWPDLQQEQRGPEQQLPLGFIISTEDTWATTAAPEAQSQQQPAVKENAWSRKLPFVQQKVEEAFMHEEPQQQPVVGQPAVWHEPDEWFIEGCQQQEVQQQQVPVPNKQVLVPEVVRNMQLEAAEPDVLAVASEHMHVYSQHQQLTQHPHLQPLVEYPQQASQLTGYMRDPAGAAAAAATWWGMPFQPASLPLSMHQAPHMHPGSYHQQQSNMVQHHQPVSLQPQPQPQQQAAPVPAKVLGPRDLDPAAADVFEASLPAGLLPDNWRDLPRWGAFEMHCKFNVGGSDQETVRQVRNVFRTAKEQAVTATQAVKASQLLLQQQQQHLLLVPPQQQQVSGQMAAHPQVPGSTAGNLYPAAPAMAGVVPPSMIYVVGPEAQQQQQQQRAGPAMNVTAHYMSSVPTAQPPVPMMHWPANMMPQSLTPHHAQQHMTLPPGHHVPTSATAGTAAAGRQGQQTAPGDDGDEDLNDMLGLCGVQAG